METRRLGRTDIEVTSICLGTMTWGSQNTEAEGHEQMDYALDQGITFFDTAEMYAVPPSPEHTFRTEAIIGNWFASRGTRDRVFLASKIIGPARGSHWVREGRNRLDEPNIRAAVEGSLTRLQTDVIDLYQLHWPNRRAAIFGQLGWSPDPDEDFIAPEETLGALKRLVDEGKIRHVGLSNEGPWGVMAFLRAAERENLPRVVSVQNAYNLLNRSFEATLAEIAWREDVGLLAYAPLAAGTLSGKYLDGRVPPGTRREMDGRTSRYDTPNADAAVRAYMDVAARHGLDVCQMAIAFVARQPFVTSTIIGATSMDQLRTDIAAREVTLSDEVIAELEAVHKRYTYPCP
ncbi:MAG: NADP(H)-dependent aldo-keto reductase [Azospirillaceae bacterium]